MAIPERPKLEEIPLPPKPGLLGGWGEKLERTLLRFVLQTFNTVMSPFWAAKEKATNYFIDQIAEEVKPLLNPYLDWIEATPNLPEPIRDTIRRLRGTPAVPLIAIAIPMVLSGLIGLIIGMVSPIQRLGAYAVEKVAKSARMSPREAFAARRREVLGLEVYNKQFDDGGWGPELKEAWETILKPLIEVGDLGTLWIREKISEGEFTEGLAQRGYDVLDIGKIKALLEVIPPLSDIIRMAVREAFTPAIVSRFQLHAELPGEMVEWAKKQGLSTEWAKAYWAAHWELPPLTLGYEMFHREEIFDEDLKMLIKAHDVSPFWRDKLINIAYRPYTRVDVRRMYAVGVLGVEDVYRSYRDLGYDHEKATNMTDFTVAYTQSAERDLTKTDILYGYETGYFKPEEADALLISLGYDQTEADFYKAKTDFKRYQKIVDDTIEYIGKQYISGQIDQGVVYAELGKLALPAEQMNRLIRDWDLKKQAKTRSLTSEKLLSFLKGDTITPEEFSNEMSGLGYSDTYISWYLKSVGKD